MGILLYIVYSINIYPIWEFCVIIIYVNIVIYLHLTIPLYVYHLGVVYAVKGRIDYENWYLWLW